MGEPQGQVCRVCRGTGWTIEIRDRNEVAVPCRCRDRVKADSRLAASRIPARFANCTLDSFEIWDPQNPSLTEAKRKTQEFVDTYPSVERGLLFMGIVGIGKTHLAVAALRELVLEKSVRGLYANFVELVQSLQLAFESRSGREELLKPVVTAQVLVLDELGAGKLTTDWVKDLLYYVINKRYMDRRITLVTTNYTDHPKKAGEESLAQRITVPLRSRLYEMCELLDMRLEGGRDYRQHVIASHGRRR